MSTFNPGGPINGLSPQQVNDSLTETQKNALNGLYPQKTGQTTSYANGDDGFFQNGRPTPGFLTLAVNNPFGNTNRFTNDKGGSVNDGSDGSTANYAIDWCTGLGWCTTLQAFATWATAVAKYSTFSLGPYSSFFVPNADELKSIANLGLNTNCFNYPPFSIGTVGTISLWSSTTVPATTTQAYIIQIKSITVQFSFITSVKTNTTTYYLCRKHLT